MNRRDEAPRAIADPEPGYFRIRMIKNGPFVAARISHQFGFWGASINNIACGAEDADAAKADGVFRIWTTGTRIGKQEYDKLLSSPPSSPDLPIDVGSMPPPTFLESIMSAATNMPVIDLYGALEPEALAAWLADKFAPRTIRCDELLGAYKRFLQSTAAGIVSDEMTAKATDFAKMLKVEVKEVEATRVAIKEPVLAATRQIDGAGRKLSEPLVAAASEVEKRITAYLRIKEQEARRAAEEEARRKEAEAQALLDQAAEAEASGDVDMAAEYVEQADEVGAGIAAAVDVAEAPAQELTRVRTQIGATTALRDNWVYSVDDIAKVPAAYLQINDAVVKAAIKSGTRAIPGLSIRNEPKASVR